LSKYQAKSKGKRRITRQQSFFLSFNPRTIERKYVGSETHLNLGRQYRLRISEDKFECVKLKGKFIEVSTLDKSKAKQLVNDWNVQNVKIKFHTIALPLIENFKKHKI
jgi:hypothetical protein